MIRLTLATRLSFFSCFLLGSWLDLLGPNTTLGQATINFLSVTSAGGTSVTIEYSVSLPMGHSQFPTVSWLNKEPYWILLRSQGGDPADLGPQDPTPPVEEDQREIIPASKRVAGTHEIEIDLRHTHGVYSFFLCTEPSETFGYFAAPFTFKLEKIRKVPAIFLDTGEDAHETG